MLVWNYDKIELFSNPSATVRCHQTLKWMKHEKTRKIKKMERNFKSVKNREMTREEKKIGYRTLHKIYDVLLWEVKNKKLNMLSIHIK